MVELQSGKYKTEWSVFMTYTLAKDFFVEDYIGDKEDVLRSIELLQIELEHFVNMHADEDLQEAPEDVQNELGYLLYTLGKSFYIIEDYATAAQYFEMGLAFNLDVRDEFVIEMVKGYGLSLLNSDQGREGIVLEAVYDDFSAYADFCMLMGLIYFEQKQYEQAVIEFAKATNEKPDAIEGSNSYLSCYYAGQCREKQHRMDEAKEFYRKAGNYEPAKERLERIG
jgi:tetratricopeptide (TPR) repeat protein